MKFWHIILIIIAIAAMAFALGHETAYPAYKPTVERVYLPACGKLPTHVKFVPISLKQLVQKGR
jgi:hypothetical protein